jgi:hypothetical protein
MDALFLYFPLKSYFYLVKRFFLQIFSQKKLWPSMCTFCAKNRENMLIFCRKMGDAGYWGQNAAFFLCTSLNVLNLESCQKSSKA